MNANPSLKVVHGGEPGTEAALAAADPKMDQLRELMLGGVIRDHDRRVRALSEHFDAELARVTELMERRIAALQARLEPQLESLSGQLRQETSARTAALDDLDVRLHHALRTQREEAAAVLRRHEDEAAASEIRHREALAQLEAQARDEGQALRQSLGAARKELGNEKVAREDLADLMAELSLRLRGQRDFDADE